MDPLLFHIRNPFSFILAETVANFRLVPTNSMPKEESGVLYLKFMKLDYSPLTL